MTMRIPADTLRREIEQISEIISGQQEKLERGVPGEDLPSNDMNIEIFQFQLVGELKLAADRLFALVEVLDS